MLQKQTYIVRQKTTRRALICCYGRRFFKCPRELTLGRETKPDISCEWNTKFSIIPEIPSKRVHSKRIPKFSKTFPGIFTLPFSFRPEISEFLVEWKAPQNPKFTPQKRDDEHPRLFHIGVSPRDNLPLQNHA